MQALITLLGSSGVFAAVITYSVRNARKPAGKPDMAQVWREGGPDND